MKTTSKKTSQNGQNGTAKKQSRSKQTQEPSEGLRELFVDELKDIYWAEKALTKALPKMIKKTSTEELANAIEEHLAVTETHVTRLEQVFESIGEKAQAKKCEAMAGLIKEAEEIMQEHEEGVVRDAGIIMAAQKVEHYEIATYGTLCVFAKTLGEEEAASLLGETLAEEKEADETLTTIAESSINVEAAHAGE